MSQDAAIEKFIDDIGHFNDEWSYGFPVTDWIALSNVLDSKYADLKNTTRTPADKQELKQKYWKRIQEKCDELGAIEVAVNDRMTERKNYAIYIAIARVCYKLFDNPPELSEEDETTLQSFRKNMCYLWQGDKSEIVNRNLKPIFNRLNSLLNNLPEGYKGKGITRQGYSRGIRLPNQVPLEDLTDDELEGVKNAFDESGIGDIIRCYYGCNFGACNIRTWRYLPISAEGHGKVGTHYDKLSPNCFKLMMFDGEITKEHGCFQTNRGFYAIGLNPCMIVESNHLRHKAFPPEANLHRDTIEITIAPRIGESIYVDAGANAGSCVNPFSDWTRRL